MCEHAITFLTIHLISFLKVKIHFDKTLVEGSSFNLKTLIENLKIIGNIYFDTNKYNKNKIKDSLFIL